MTDRVAFPFRLQSALFTSIECKRAPQITEPVEFSLVTQLRVIDQDFPKLEVFLRAFTTSEQPLWFSAELVGIFEHVPGEPVPEQSIVFEFLNERALFMLWPYMVQMVTQLTAQMGMSPVRLITPHKYDLKPIEPSEQEGERQHQP